MPNIVAKSKLRPAIIQEKKLKIYVDNKVREDN